MDTIEEDLKATHIDLMAKLKELQFINEILAKANAEINHISVLVSKIQDHV